MWLAVMPFCMSRLETSFTPVFTPPAGLAMVFDQVNATVASRPCEKRLVIFACSESYQLLPSGAHSGLMLLLNCGYGRRLWYRLLLVLNPAYGMVNPLPVAIAALSGPLRSDRSVALFRSSPLAFRDSAEGTFRATRLDALPPPPLVP